MQRWYPIACCALALGCAGLLSEGGGQEAPQAAGTTPNLHALRVHVANEIAIVVDGDADPQLGTRLVTAVETELGRQGVTVVRDATGNADVTIHLETRVRGAVSFLRGHLALTAEKADAAVAVASTEDELHREGDFVAIMAQKAVSALLRTPGLAELAAKKVVVHAATVPKRSSPRLVAVRRAPLTPVTSPTEEARSHANRAMSLYNLGHFREALTEYEAAYMAVQDPPFLYNIAQCHRKMGNYRDAIGFYRSYLRVAPHAQNRTEAQRHIAELEHEHHRAR